MALPGLRMNEAVLTVEPLSLGARLAGVSPRVRVAAGGAWAVATSLVIADFGVGPKALVGIVFVTALAVLAAIDVEQRVLPNRIVLPSFAVVLALQLAFFPAAAAEWIVAALGVGLLLFIAALVKPRGLGYGDVKLGLLLGAGLGEQVVLCFVVAVVAMWPFALYLYARHGRAAGRMALPFGPFLALGAVVALLASS